jgi:PPM family protein phosphatase
MAMIDIASAGLSDIGRKRHSNQDAYLMDDVYGLYVVADGMGGHQAGEVAAKIVVDSIHQYYTASPPDADQATTPHDPSLSPDANRLCEAIHYANQKVYQAAADNKAYQGMGSTLAAVQFARNTFIAANVGDSPIYLVHENSIETLSVPHTLMAEHQEFHPEDHTIFSPDLQHMLTRGMGVEDTVQPDICESPCFDGDRLIVCSDGLSGKVTPEEMLTVAATHSPPDACQTLVEMANQRGGDDNITVLVLHVHTAKTLFQRLRHWCARLTGSN